MTLSWWPCHKIVSVTFTFTLLFILLLWQEAENETHLRTFVWSLRFSFCVLPGRWLELCLWWDPAHDRSPGKYPSNWVLREIKCKWKATNIWEYLTNIRPWGMVISTQICGKPNCEEWYSRLRGVVVLDQSTCYQRPWEIVLKTKRSGTQDRVVLKTQMCGPWDQEEWYSQPRWVVLETRRSGTHSQDEWSLRPGGVVLTTQMSGPWDQEERYSQPRWVVLKTKRCKRSGSHDQEEWYGTGSFEFGRSERGNINSIYINNLFTSLLRFSNILQ